MTTLRTRPIRPAEWSEWLRMSIALFPDITAEELERGMRDFSNRTDAQILVAERADGSLCGFVEAGTRPYADGCDTGPVGYIEAWYVDPDVRLTGCGRALLRASEEWARRMGYLEMASDCLLDNDISLQAHLRTGYEEVERAIRFRKKL